MKKLTYTPDVPEITMPQTNSIAVWKAFFVDLMAKDYFAPFHALMACHAIIESVTFGEMPSMFASFYYDLGIELCADDRYPAMKAALETGFIVKGISMVICAAAAHDEYFDDLMVVVEAVAEYSQEVLSKLPAAVAKMARELLDEYEVSIADVKSEAACSDADSDYWQSVMEEKMNEDPTASQSVLAYYLAVAAGQVGRIHCPLGWKEYEDIGREMAYNEAVLEAAIKCGLLADSIPSYVSAALDNPLNWSLMSKGVSFIINDPGLSVFVSYRDRKVACTMLELERDCELEDEVWDAKVRSLWSEFGKAYRGY